MDIIVTSSNANAMGSGKYIPVGIALWRGELVAGEFKQLPVGVSKVDRVHKATIDIACVPDAPFVQPLSNLGIGGTRDIQGKVVQVPGAFRIGCWIVRPAWTNEAGNQLSITGIKVEVSLFLHIQARLIDDERHTKYACIEINGCLTVRANKGDVMHTLDLDFRHGWTSAWRLQEIGLPLL